MSKKLNLGCRTDIKTGFINIDIINFPHIDVQADVTELPFADCSIDYFLAKDLLEHFSWRIIPVVLKEWFRVLKSGGEFEIETPSLEALVYIYVKRPPGWEKFRKMYADDECLTDPVCRVLYGGQGNNTNFHYTCFDKETIMYHLNQIGIVNFDIKLPVNVTNMIVQGYKN